MKDSNQRLHFLISYRTHLRQELDQMGYGRVTQGTAERAADAPDRVTSTIAIVAMMLVFASVFIVQ